METEWTYDNRIESIRNALEVDGCLSHLMLLVAFGGIGEIKLQVASAFQEGRIHEVIDVDPFYHYPDSVALRNLISGWFPHHSHDILKFDGYYLTNIANPDRSLRNQQERILHTLFDEFIDQFNFHTITDDYSIALMPTLNIWAYSTSEELGVFPVALKDNQTRVVTYVLLNTSRHMEIMSILLREGSIDGTIWRRCSVDAPLKFGNSTLTRNILELTTLFKEAGMDNIILHAGDRRGVLSDTINFSLPYILFPRSHVLRRWFQDHNYSYYMLLDKLNDSQMREFHYKGINFSVYAFNLIEAIEKIKRSQQDVPYNIAAKRKYVLVFTTAQSDQVIEITRRYFDFFTLFPNEMLSLENYEPKDRRRLRRLNNSLRRKIVEQGYNILQNTGVSVNNILYFPIIDVDSTETF